MIFLALLLVVLFILILWFFLFPVRFIPSLRKGSPFRTPPPMYVYSFVLHIHTQFSYDSLGKPEDIVEALSSENIDFAIITDHDNSDIGKFPHRSLVPGVERKIYKDGMGLVGDILEAGEVRVIAHPFREKYRWKLEKEGNYLLELIDLRDALLESKLRFSLYMIAGIITLPFIKLRVVQNFRKLVDVERYVRRFFSEGWKMKVVGGHDHHVKLYINEVDKRYLIPDYKISFKFMRNFLLTKERIDSKEKFLKALQQGFTIISFSEKSSFVWTEEGRVVATSPYQKTLFVLHSQEGVVDQVIGSNYDSQNRLKRGYYILTGFTYSFRIWRLLFNVKPLFVSDIMEVE